MWGVMENGGGGWVDLSPVYRRNPGYTWTGMSAPCERASDWGGHSNGDRHTFPGPGCGNGYVMFRERVASLNWVHESAERGGARKIRSA